MAEVPAVNQGVSNDASDDPEDLIAKFGEWDRRLDAHWGAWVNEAKECYALVAGDQWDAEAKEQMIEAERAPVTFNRVAPTIDAVSGAEIMGRQEVIYEPRQLGASAQNEVLTKGAKWVRDECDAEHEDSEAAWDCFVCGVGVTETLMSYEEEPDGQIIVERVDPIEVAVDPSSKKACFLDRRYQRRRRRYSKDEFEVRWPGASPDGDPGTNNGGKPVIVDPERRYKGGVDELADDEVYVDEWQWFDTVPFHRIGDPEDGTVKTVQHNGDVAGMVAKENELRAQAGKRPLIHVRQTRRRYRKAFVAMGQLLEPAIDIEAGAFTYNFMTGKRDRNSRVWYGLVRAMADPQRFANKFFSQILGILNSNAKGGLFAEEDAFADQRKAEESYADPAAITMLKSGALSGPNGAKIKQKEAPAYPEAQDRLMELSVTAIQDVTGVNKEMLGLADREQAGTLEHQRKQAAYGILSAFFDAFRRYRKGQGRLLLKFMQLYLPPDYLVRIVGQDGSPTYQAIGTAFKDTRFTVIVDETPAGPNEKAQVWSMIVQLMPMLQQADLGADFWAEIVPYAPFPTALAFKLQQMLSKLASGPPTPEEQLAQEAAAAKVRETNASAAHKEGQAAVLQSEVGSKAASQDAARKLDLAKTAAILTKESQELEPASDPTTTY